MNVTLLSNTGDFSTNTTSNFRVKLPKQISFEGKWEVAATGIQYPSSWNGMRQLEGNLSFNYHFLNLDFKLDINFPPEQFTNINDLVKKVNLAIKMKGETLPLFEHNVHEAKLRMRILFETDPQKYLTWIENRNYDIQGTPDLIDNPLLIPEPSEPPTSIEPGTILDKLYQSWNTSEDQLRKKPSSKNILRSAMKLVYNNVTNHLEFRCKFTRNNSTKTINTVEFDSKLQSALGFNKSQTIVSGINVSNNKVDIGGIESEFYIHSSVVQPQFFGNSLKPVLRIVPVNSKALTQQKYQEFKVLHYVDILTNEFDTIETQILNELGENIKFQFGKIILHLHFRRKHNVFS